MATVHVFVGQCGNQLGTAFLDALASEARASGSEAYQMLVSAQHFRPALRRGSVHHGRTWGSDAAAAAVQQQQQRQMYDALPQPRCVMVDMEPKVIEQAVARHNHYVSSSRNDNDNDNDKAGERGWCAHRATATRPLYTLAPQQCVTRDEGSGNNWAYGYAQQGQSRHDAIAECLRRESECADATVTAYHVVHAVAGGTGSGVGSLVAEVIADAYPRATLLHTLVWPFAAGEVVTQWYNLALSLSTLRDRVDGALIVYNDAVREALLQQHAHRGLRGKGEVSYARINACMSRLLTPLHLPQLLCNTTASTSTATSSSCCTSPRPPQHSSNSSSTMAQMDDSPCVTYGYARLADMLEPMCLDPCTKFFTAAAVPSPCAATTSATTTTTTMSSVAELTTWHGVLHDAVRLAHDDFAVANCTSAVQLYTRSGGATGSSSSSSTSSMRLLRPCCVWALRGATASSAGVRELRRLLASCSRDDGSTDSGGSCSVPLSTLLVSPSYRRDDYHHDDDDAPHMRRARGGGNTRTCGAGVATSPRHVDGAALSRAATATAAAAADEHSTHADCEVTLYGPTAHVGRQLAYALRRAEELLHANAFVHHFERYGVGKADLCDAVTMLWDTVGAYDASVLAA